MQLIKTEGLDCLGLKGCGPWRLDDDRLVRTTNGVERLPLTTQRDAQAVYDAYRAVWETGVPAPRPLEIVRTQEGYGVVVEYVHGTRVGLQLIFGLVTHAEVGQKLGALQRALHAAHTSVGKDWNAAFVAWAHELSSLVPDGLGDKLVTLVESVPRQSRLLHGDLHLENAVMHKGELIPIDMEYVGYGNPLFDLAISCSRMRYNLSHLAFHTGKKAYVERLRKAGAAIWEAHLRSYLADAGQDELDQVSRVIDVLAEVENYSFLFYGKTVTDDAMARRRQRCLAQTSERLALLLPQITSPYL